MLRKLATPVLLVLLSLNGLWMVCAPDESAEDQDMATALEKENCAEICLMRAKEAGITCFLLAGDESITTFSLGYALLPEVVTLSFAPQISQNTTDLVATYPTLSLDIFTPPPKA